MSAIYIVATPIGNLEDITLRAIRTLREVSLIAAEDTRKTRQLLKTYGIKTPLTSYHEHNKLTKLDYILGQLEQGDVAIVSDAGMPGISDPGYELINAAVKKDLKIIVIPGPSALTASLAVSGQPTDSFYYLGFLPHKAGDRKKTLKSRSNEKSTLVLFESPHRLKASLIDMLDILGDRQIAVCREMTKIHEEIFRGRISEAIGHFTEPRGEFTLVIAGNTEIVKQAMVPDIIIQLEQMRKSGMTAKQAIGQITEQSGLSRKELYQAWISNK
jgi:16S rRNA (cytidine1402-2'-O)-methyltransferase